MNNDDTPSAFSVSHYVLLFIVSTLCTVSVVWVLIAANNRESAINDKIMAPKNAAEKSCQRTKCIYYGNKNHKISHKNTSHWKKIMQIELLRFEQPEHVMDKGLFAKWVSIAKIVTHVQKILPANARCFSIFPTPLTMFVKTIKKTLA